MTRHKAELVWFTCWLTIALIAFVVQKGGLL